MSQYSPPKPKCQQPDNQCHQTNDQYYENSNVFWVPFVWLIIILIVVCFLLYIFKPKFVLKTDEDGNTIDEIDNGKVFGWSVFIAIVLVLIFCLSIVFSGQL